MPRVLKFTRENIGSLMRVLAGEMLNFECGAEYFRDGVFVPKTLTEAKRLYARGYPRWQDNSGTVVEYSMRAHSAIVWFPENCDFATILEDLNAQIEHMERELVAVDDTVDVFTDGDRANVAVPNAMSEYSAANQFAMSQLKIKPAQKINALYSTLEAPGKPHEHNNRRVLIAAHPGATVHARFVWYFSALNDVTRTDINVLDMQVKSIIVDLLAAVDFPALEQDLIAAGEMTGNNDNARWANWRPQSLIDDACVHVTTHNELLAALSSYAVVDVDKIHLVSCSQPLAHEFWPKMELTGGVYKYVKKYKEVSERAVYLCSREELLTACGIDWTAIHAGSTGATAEYEHCAHCSARVYGEGYICTYHRASMKTPRPTVFCAACFIIANAAQDFFHIMRCNFPRTYADYIESRDCDSVRGSVKHTNARKDILLAALEGVTRVKLGRYDLFLIGSKYIGCDRDYQVLSSVYAHDPIFAGRIVCPVEYHELRHVL